jgi:hypothetical protein
LQQEEGIKVGPSKSVARYNPRDPPRITGTPRNNNFIQDPLVIINFTP